jgi:hypothetical protein
VARSVKAKRRDTRLEAEGAEFLVLGCLLVEGIDAYKSYRYMQGYDLVAALPEKNSTARIQVKSRWSSNASTFMVKNYDCDFVVFAKLNRGLPHASKPESKKSAPVFYVFPAKLVQDNRVRHSTWGRVVLSQIPDFQSYKERWDLIRSFLVQRR